MALMKKCYVPCCLNTSRNSAKLFITVPSNKIRRKQWCDLVGLPHKGTTPLYCCEDHFDIQKDAENWMFYKTMGGRLLLHKHVVPHHYLTKPLVISDSTALPEEQRKKLKREGDASSHSTFVPSNKPLEDITNQEGNPYVQPHKPVSAVKDSPIASSSSTSQSTLGSLYTPTKDSAEYSSDSESNISPLKGRRLETTVVLIETKSRFYLGLPKEVYKTVKFVTEVASIPYIDDLITLKKNRPSIQHLS